MYIIVIVIKNAYFISNVYTSIYSTYSTVLYMNIAERGTYHPRKSDGSARVAVELRNASEPRAGRCGSPENQRAFHRLRHRVLRSRGKTS